MQCSDHIIIIIRYFFLLVALDGAALPVRETLSTIAMVMLGYDNKKNNERIWACEFEVSNAAAYLRASPFLNNSPRSVSRGPLSIIVPPPIRHVAVDL